MLNLALCIGLNPANFWHFFRENPPGLILCEPRMAQHGSTEQVSQEFVDIGDHLSGNAHSNIQFMKMSWHNKMISTSLALYEGNHGDSSHQGQRCRALMFPLLVVSSQDKISNEQSSCQWFKIFHFPLATRNDKHSIHLCLSRNIYLGLC